MGLKFEKEQHFDWKVSLPIPDNQFLFGHIWTNKLRRLIHTWFDKANAACRFRFSMTIHLNVHRGCQNNPFPHSSHAWLDCTCHPPEHAPAPHSFCFWLKSLQSPSITPLLLLSFRMQRMVLFLLFPKVFFVNKLRSNSKSEVCERSSLSVVGTLPFLLRKCRMNEND